MDDRYGADVLATGWKSRGVRELPRVAASRDLVVEVADDGFCGAVVGVSGGMVELEDRVGRRRLFPLGPGFLIDGRDVVLGPPAAAPAVTGPRRTASGSFAAPDARATSADSPVARRASPRRVRNSSHHTIGTARKPR